MDSKNTSNRKASPEAVALMMANKRTNDSAGAKTTKMKRDSSTNRKNLFF